MADIDLSKLDTFGKNCFYLPDNFFDPGLLGRIGMWADGAGRYPGHIKPLEQVVHVIQAARHGELLGRQLANFFATDPSTATVVL